MYGRNSSLAVAALLAALVAAPLAHADTKGTPAPIMGQDDAMMKGDMQGMMSMMQMMIKMAPMMEACAKMMQSTSDQPATPMMPHGEQNKG